jgi:hypothetical protein
MPRRLPSSALDQQTQITASGTGAILAGTWYIGTAGGGSGGAVAGTLNGPLTGTADSAKVLTPGKQLNGQTFTGSDHITVPVNTTSIATSGTYYPTFVPSNTAGNQQASTNLSFKYDPSTGYLSATRFVGSGAGLTDLIIPSYGLSAVDGAGSTAKVRLYSSSTVAFNQNTATSIQRILVGLGALDAGETALRAVFYTTNPNTGQPYGDLNGDGAVDQSDSIIILQLVAGSISPTARSNQLLAAIGASANAGAIVTYGWINSNLAGDVTLAGSGGITVSRTDNTITFNAPSVDLTGYATENYVTTRGYATETYVGTAIANSGAGGGNLRSNLILNGYNIQGTGTIGITGTVTATAFYYASDRTLKTDIQNIVDCDSVIDSLRPVSFTWIKTGQKDLGFIAQEVQDIIPTAVSANKDGILSVNYSNIVAHLTAKVKNQDSIIKDLQNKVELLMKKL